MRLLKGKTSREKYINILISTVKKISNVEKNPTEDGQKLFILEIAAMLYGVCLLFDTDTPSYYKKWLINILTKNEETFRAVIAKVKDK